MKGAGPRRRVDEVASSTDNPFVSLAPFRRPVLGLLLAAATVSAGVLPPSHIHLASDDHDHHHTAAVEHSHWAAHQHARTQIDDDDGQVLFVDRPSLSGSAYQGVARPATAVIAVLLSWSPATFTRHAPRISGNAPRDGPSRDVTFLRGPPFVL